jgi:hypothetical protein
MFGGQLVTGFPADEVSGMTHPTDTHSDRHIEFIGPAAYDLKALILLNNPRGALGSGGRPPCLEQAGHSSTYVGLASNLYQQRPLRRKIGHGHEVCVPGNMRPTCVPDAEIPSQCKRCVVFGAGLWRVLEVRFDLSVTELVGEFRD